MYVEEMFTGPSNIEGLSQEFLANEVADAYRANLDEDFAVDNVK